jgi:hypothetical protein
VSQINGKVPGYPDTSNEGVIADRKEPGEPAQELTSAQMAVKRLCQWKMLLARWQMGERFERGPEFDALCDQRGLVLILRAELNALLSVLVETRIIKHADFDLALEACANRDNTNLSLRFPGYYGTDEGLAVDVAIAKGTNERYQIRS